MARSIVVVVFALVVVASLGGADATKRRTFSPRIFGGSPAGVGDYTYNAYLSAADFLCSGSLISPHHIITAAHCCDNPTDWIGRQVYVGGLNNSYMEENYEAGASKGGESVTVVAVQVHPKYDPETYVNDFCVFTTATAVEATPIELSTSTARPEVQYAVGYAAGWGLIDDTTLPYVLYAVQIPFVPISECRVLPGYENLIESQFCAANLTYGGPDTCGGDSGGPFVSGPPSSQSPPVLLGVTSYGPLSCGIPESPGVYGWVAEELSWICTASDYEPNNCAGVPPYHDDSAASSLSPSFLFRRGEC